MILHGEAVSLLRPPTPQPAVVMPDWLCCCSQVKKMLSANAEAPLNIEFLMDDVDVKGHMSRDAFEGLCQPLLERFQSPLQKVPPPQEALTLPMQHCRLQAILPVKSRQFRLLIAFVSNSE